MKKFIIFLLTAFLLAPGFSSLPQAKAATVFPDVPENSLNYQAISYLKAENVVNGYPDGTFKMDNRILRSEFAKILAEIMFTDEEIEACQDTSFPDVPDGEWFEKYVCVHEKNGTINGYPDGTFGPAKYIQFDEAAKIIAEAEKLVGVDTPEGEAWYTKYVKALENENAIPSTVAFLSEPITRAEMSEMTYRIDAQIKDKVSLTYEQVVDPLPTLDSCDLLEEKMNEYQSRQIYYYDYLPLPMEVMDAEAAPPAAVEGATLNSNKSADDYSETNVQVEGVDEADIIKNDGKYIYIVKGSTVRIVEAYPADQMKELSMIDFDTDALYSGFNPQEVYLTGDRLVVIGMAQNYYYAKPLTPEADELSILPPHHNKRQSKVFVYDVSDPSQPEKLREAAFDGYYNTSRRIGDQVYLVLNASPNYWAWDTIEFGEDFLPTFRDGLNEAQKMAECADIHYFPGHEMPQFLITASVNINDADQAIDTDVVLGSSDNVYVSQNNMYVTNTIYDRDSFTDWDWANDNAKSHVYKFKLNQGDIDFVARGEVPGRPLNQFSMDEHKNNFRIATTTGDMWSGSNPSKNHVYVLDANLKQVGAVEDLAPGEKIYSTRFVGDRGYVVTFKKVDPLFVLDLATPSNPKVLGKLKIPGYSDYLHPYDENHIIGFGKDAADPTTEQQEARSLDFAWYQGFKMAIFDVTDPSNPIQQHVEAIGDRYTESELLYNHKALLFDKEKGLLAFPITINEKIDENDTDPLAETETTFSGAVVYDVDLQNGFTERGRITHFTEEDILKAGSNWQYNYQKAIQRILYIGDYLYTVAQGGVKASEMDTVNEINYVELEGGDENGGVIYY